MQHRFKRSEMPTPAVPGLVSAPANAKFTRKVGERWFVKILDARQVIGRCSVFGQELFVPLAPHALTMLSEPVNGGVEDDDRTAWPQTTLRLREGAGVVGGVMQRGIEERGVETT